MKPEPTQDRPSATQRPSDLELSELIPVALGAAGLFLGPMVAQGSLTGVLSGCAAAATFFGGSLAVLRTFGRSLVPAVLANAVSGAAGGLVYWLLARPELTAVGTAGLGAIAGAAMAPFQLIWVEFRSEMARLEANSESGFEYTGLISTLWRALTAIRPHRRGQAPPHIGGDNGAA